MFYFGLEALRVKNWAIRDMWIIEDNAENHALRIRELRRDVQYAHNAIQDLIKNVLFKGDAPTVISRRKAEEWKRDVNQRIRPRVENSAKVLSDMKEDVDAFFKNPNKTPDRINFDTNKAYRTWVTYNVEKQQAQSSFTGIVEQRWQPAAKKLAAEYRAAYKKYQAACEKLRKQTLWAEFVTWKDVDYEEMGDVVDRVIDSLKDAASDK